MTTFGVEPNPEPGTRAFALLERILTSGRYPPGSPGAVQEIARRKSAVLVAALAFIGVTLGGGLFIWLGAFTIATRYVRAARALC